MKVPTNAPISPEELDALTALARRAIWSPGETRRKLQAARVNIVPANFYATVPSIEDVERSFEYAKPGHEVYNQGLFDPGRLGAHLAVLSRHAGEFDPPLTGDPDNPAGFYWQNPAFSFSDAMAYYCMLRETRPSRVVEVGSGFSTLVADLALRRNGSGTLTLIEPWPKPFLRKLPTVERIIASPVQDIALSTLVPMIEEAGCWFIDSTHTVKTGSDCLWLYLKVMPAIAGAVSVHAHDIYLPFGMPQRLALDRHIYWTEQYLLYAYMLENARVEVLYSSAYAAARLAPALSAMMGGKYRPGGASIWFQLAART